MARRTLFGIVGYVLRRLLPLLVPALLAACGGQVSSSRTVSAQQALTQNAEFLEFETASTRADLFRDVTRASVAQAGHSGPVMFPVLRDGELVAARGIEPGTDLLMSAD